MVVVGDGMGMDWIRVDGDVDGNGNGIAVQCSGWGLWW